MLLPEGEKDVDRLRAAGFVATTNAMGAGKWQPDYAEMLRDRRVVLLPDNDAEGEAHVAKQGASLARVAREVRVLRLPDLPPKGDISDWFDAGGTPDELARLIDATPPWKPRQSQDATSATGAEEQAADSTTDTGAPRSKIFTAKTLQAKTFPPFPWAIPGSCPKGRRSCAARRRSASPAWSCNSPAPWPMAASPSVTPKWPKAEPSYLALEDGERRLQERLVRFFMMFASLGPTTLTFATAWPTIDQGCCEELAAYLTEHPETRFVIVDVLQMIRPRTLGRDNAYAADYATMRALKAVADGMM